MPDAPPSPVSVTDFWLRELVDELKGLRADMASARTPAPPAGGVELREPKPTAKAAPAKKAVSKRASTPDGKR